MGHGAVPADPGLLLHYLKTGLSKKGSKSATTVLPLVYSSD